MMNERKIVYIPQVYNEARYNQHCCVDYMSYCVLLFMVLNQLNKWELNYELFEIVR